MSDNNITNKFKVETKNATYYAEFSQIQIEITGKCNMKCAHCRAVNEPKKDMPINEILKILKFARLYSPNYREVIISGGEPLLHGNFPEVLKRVKENGGESITLTTNGFFLTQDHINLIKSLEFKKFTLSISLDHLEEKEHDTFRGLKGAFKKAMSSIEMLKQDLPQWFIKSIRVTLKPEQIDLMSNYTEFAYRNNLNRVSFSCIHPVGNAKNKPEFWANKSVAKRFITNYYEEKEKYRNKLRIDTNDPLKCMLRKDTISTDETKQVFNGCGAGAITFNVGVDGTMTPCALLQIPILNINGLNEHEILEQYIRSPIVKNMLDMDLKGKCGTCEKKFNCGGCRARAYSIHNDYLGEDPNCWYS